MRQYFFDSSALIKRYVAEQGTTWVRSTTTPGTANTIVVAEVTQIEVFSGLARRRREGFLRPRSVQALRLMLERHIKREYVVVGLSNLILGRALDLLDTYPLRAYDSIQLASALEVKRQLAETNLELSKFVSADMRLLGRTLKKSAKMSHTSRPDNRRACVVGTLAGFRRRPTQPPQRIRADPEV